MTLGHTNTLTIGSEAWLKVVNGSHTLKIVATDAKVASVTRTLTFTKAVTSRRVRADPRYGGRRHADQGPRQHSGQFPGRLHASGLDLQQRQRREPTWEDITQKVKAGQKHYFTNKTKTAAAWGVKVKAELLRGSATETCYIQSIGGNFA